MRTHGSRHFLGFLIEHYGENFPLWLAPDQVRVLHDDAALINYAKPIMAELRANMVRVDADFSATPQKWSAEHCSACPGYNQANANLRSNASRSGCYMEASAVSVRLHYGGSPRTKPNG